MCVRGGLSRHLSIFIYSLSCQHCHYKLEIQDNVTRSTIKIYSVFPLWHSHLHDISPPLFELGRLLTEHVTNKKRCKTLQNNKSTFSGESRINSRGRCANLLFCKWKWKNWTEGRGIPGAPLDPPLTFSSIALNQRAKISDFSDLVTKIDFVIWFVLPCMVLPKPRIRETTLKHWIFPKSE